VPADVSPDNWEAQVTQEDSLYQVRSGSLMKSFFIILLIVLALNCVIGCLAAAGSLMCLPDWLKGSDDEDEFEDERKDEAEQSAFISGDHPMEPFSITGGPTGNNK